MLRSPQFDRLNKSNARERYQGGRHGAQDITAIVGRAGRRCRQRAPASPPVSHRRCGAGAVGLCGERPRRGGGGAAGRAVDAISDHGGLRALRLAVAVREACRARRHAAAGERAARARLHPHPAAPAQRHHHAERPALRAAALGRPRHRSRQAQAPDPRPGRPSADLHARHARQVSDGVAHLLPGMRRQHADALSAQADPGRRAAHPRPDLLRRTGPACGSPRCWRRPASSRMRNGSWRKAPTPPAWRAACRSPRSWTMRSSRSTRTASGCGRRTAIRCGCSCPATRATRR